MQPSLLACTMGIINLNMVGANRFDPNKELQSLYIKLKFKSLKKESLQINFQLRQLKASASPYIRVNQSLKNPKIKTKPVNLTSEKQPPKTTEDLHNEKPGMNPPPQITTY